MTRKRERPSLAIGTLFAGSHPHRPCTDGNSDREFSDIECETARERWHLLLDPHRQPDNQALWSVTLLQLTRLNAFRQGTHQVA